MSMISLLSALLTPADVKNAPNGTANDVLVAGLNLLYFVAGVIAVVAIIIAGFTLVTNSSEPDAVKKARNTILYAVIGIVVIVSAFTITWFISRSIK